MVSAEEHAKVEQLWRDEKAKNKIFEDALIKIGTGMIFQGQVYENIAVLALKDASYI
jgi:hypothetical protein